MASHTQKAAEINVQASQELMEISIRNLLTGGKTETEIRRMVEAQLNGARNG